MKEKNTNKGITLIALVITIIVMLILVAVTITMAVNGGLFEYASKAGTQTNAAVDAEQELASGKIKIGNTWYDSPQDYVDGTPTVIPPNPQEKFSNIYDKNTKIEQEGGYTAVIPKGFAVAVDDKGEIKSIADGLVITDKVNSKGQSTGNEFVWIPVKYTKAGDENVAEKKLDSNFLNVFKRSNADDLYYSEPYAGGYSDGNGTQEKADYYDMMKSVQDNYGFYIGRYEAGTTEERKHDFDNGTDTLVVKRDAMPYNYVAWGKSMSDYTSIIKYDFNSGSYSETGKDQGKGAVLLSKELYGKTADAGKYGVVSTLCYGVQWDAMLKFMGKDTEIDAGNWGNFTNNNLKITRASAKYWDEDEKKWNLVTEPGTSCGQLLTTGASESFSLKNIFDIAGNCGEFTMEVLGGDTRSARGR